jgi:hypothetical protein
METEPDRETTGKGALPRDRTISLAIVIASLAVIVAVSFYMITGGLMESGAPTAQAPVAPPANPQR